MTWPTKKAATVFLPPRYCSSCLGLAAMTSSIIFSMAEASEICCGLSPPEMSGQSSPSAILLELLGVGGDDFVDHLFDGGGVGDLLRLVALVDLGEVLAFGEGGV